MDKATSISNAQKYLAKGQIDKAIAEWEKIAEIYPEGNTFNYMGDLYLKKGNNAGALETYHKAAKIYMDEGFSLKALAIYKKVLNVNPSDAMALIALGELSESKRIATDAIKYYLSAADVLAKNNKKQELQEVYAKIINLAPDNINLRVKMAEMFSKQGFVKEAANEYYSVGAKLLEHDKLEKARVYLMKSFELQPNSGKTLIALSRLSERSGDMEEASKYTQIAIEKTGESSVLLLRSAHLFIAGGSLKEAEGCILKVIESEPGNADAREELAALYDKTGEPRKAWDQYSMVIDAIAEGGETERATSILQKYKKFDAMGVGRKLAMIYKKLGDEQKAVAELEELVALYEENGMTDDALWGLKAAFEIQPYNFEFKEKIDALEAAKAPATQAEEAPAAAAPDEGPDFADELASLGQGADAGLDDLPDLGEAPSMASGAAPAMAEPSVSEQSQASKPIGVLLNEADAFLQYGLYEEARGILDKLKIREPANEEVHLKLKALYTETRENEQAVTECIILSNIANRNGDKQKADEFIREAFKLNPADPRLEGRVPADAIASAPSAPAMDDRKSDADESIPGMEKIDSSQVVDFEDDVMEIFNEFKKGLEGEIEGEDAETHYNLGIAYKEMGLVDDAIKEFQTSKADKKYFVNSMTMLGICFMEKQMYSLAIDSFRDAMKKVEKGDDSSWSIMYDLAAAYEMNEDYEEALRYYTDVYGWNAKYREVAEKIEALKGNSSARPSGRAQQPPEAPRAPRPEAVREKPPKEKKNRVSYI